MNPRTEFVQRCIVSGAEPFTSQQGTVYAPGICNETVGATALFLGIVTLAPGQRTKAHVHFRHESAFYLLSGEEVELWTGDELQHHTLHGRATTSSSPPVCRMWLSIGAGRNRPSLSAHAMTRLRRRAP
jgi:uncharacterized RmlC-like cupin family protein